MGRRIFRAFTGLPTGKRSEARAKKGTPRVRTEPLERRVLLAAHIVGSQTVYPTIQAAVTAASAGATINVDAGTYPELVTVNKTLTINGAMANVDARSNARQSGVGESVVDGTTESDGTSSAFYITASDVTINGFTCTGNTSITFYNAAIVIAPNISGTHIINNILENNIAGIDLANASATDAAVIQYNVFSHNNNVSANGGRGIYSNGTISGGTLQNVTIDSNFFVGNHGDPGTTTGEEAGISLEATSSVQTNIRVTNNTFERNGKAFLAWNASNLTFTGNVATDQQDTGSATFRFEGGDTNVTIQNNNIFDNLTDASRLDQKALAAVESGFTITNNNMYGNGYQGAAGSTGSLNVAASSYTGTLTATGNWWGSPTGPSGDAPGAGDGLFANSNPVTYSPFATSPVVTQQSPFDGLASVTNAQIQAVNFDQGGPGIGYNVAGSLNGSSNYRNTAVQIAATTDPGSSYDTPYAVTGFAAGNWLAYTVNVAQSGNYQFALRVADASTGTVHATVDGTTVGGTLTIPNTGGASTWQTISSPSFALTAGTHILKLNFDTGSFGSIHWLDLVPFIAPTAPASLTAAAISSSQINLTWTDTSVNQTAFEVDRSTDGGVFFTPLTTTLNGGATSYNDTTAAAGTTYTYRVIASNTAGVSPASNTAKATTLATNVTTTNLSTLTWTSATVGDSKTIQLNKSVNGSTLTLRGTTYTTGIGTHAVSQIVYNLGGQYNFFQSDVGVDDEVIAQGGAGVGSIDFQVFGDGNLLADSGIVTSSSAIYHISVNVTGVQQLTILATNGIPNNIDFDHADWAGAALIVSPAVPQSPSNVAGTANGTSGVNLSWTNTATNQTGFEVDRSVNGTTFTSLTPTPLPATATSYSDSGLTAGTTYYYRVLALNATGPSPSSNVPAVVTTPKVNPTFTGTSSATITYGTATTTISGTISNGAQIPTGNVSIIINGVTTPAAITQTTGAFSVSVATQSIPASTTPYTITFSYAGDPNFNAGTDTTKTLTVNQRVLHVTATGVNKVYDGTTTGTVTFSDDRLSGDVFTVGATSITFADKTVGTGKTETVSGISLSGAAAGNYSVASTSATATANITARALVVSAAATNKIYDGTTTASVTLLDNRVTNDQLTVAFTAAAFSDKNAGTGKTVTVSGISVTGADAANYTFNTTATTTATITPRALTISAAGVNKVYDGTATASVTLSDNRISGDVFTESFTAATFPDKNVGTGKAVSVTGVSISGTDAPNYTFNTTASTTANITTKVLTVSAAGTNKTYDGTATASVTLSDNRVSGDSLTDSFTTATFADKNVGTAKTVTVSGISVTGNDAGNYTFNTTATTTANIAPLALTISATGVNKIYDGTTTASVTLTDNRVSGDVFNDNFTAAAFPDKNVGTAKAVSVTGISISGTDAANYTFNTTASTSANITARSLTVSATAANKVYDGTTTAGVTLTDNRVGGDVFTDNFAAAAFANKNVGTAKTVSVSGITITGADAANYTANTTATATANITTLALTVSATGVNKVYDGTAAASVTLSDNRVSGDVFTDNFTNAGFADKNVGTSKIVSVSGISVGGTDAANYTFNTTAGTTANITARVLTVSASANNKVYDGTTAATITLSDNRVSGDVLTDSFTGAAFSDKNVGNGKTVAVSGISVTGTDAGNYTFNTTTTTTANITPLALTVSATGVNKTYDGTATATITLSDNHVSGDNVTDSYTTAAFANKSVANGKTVTVSGISISGMDAGNYTANTTATTTANITPLALTVSATGVNKVYNGTTAATVTLSDNRISGDVFTDGFTTATFSDKNVGTGKTISVSGISLSGIDAANYTFNTTATATANITPLALTLSGSNKVYDGTAAANVALANAIGGDNVTLTYTSAAFSDKNVASAKTISVSGTSLGGTDAGNYSIGTSGSATANITPFALTVSAAGTNKTYDGTTAATVTLSDNRIGGDIFSDTYTAATFSDKNVGTVKTINVSGISIGGTDAGNYTFNTTATTAANITARTLHVGAAGVNKVYDGTTVATVTFSDDRASGDQVTETDTSATFADDNVGTAKPISVSGISISGTDAADYTLANTTAATSANISERLLMITATGVNKIYDGTTAATVTLTDNRVSGDILTDNFAIATFSDKNVGNSKAISVAGLYITGMDSSNYFINSSTTASANITPLTLTVSASAQNKGYDGTTSASVTLSDNRAAGDTLTESFTSASFSDKNVANGKTVAVNGITFGGADAGNYTLGNTTATTTANITPKTLTITASGTNKVYDGTTAATVVLSDNRISGDVFTDSFTSAAFSDKNVGNGKPINVSGVSISGQDAGNYTAGAITTATANITPLALSLTGTNKVYDGTAAATVSLANAIGTDSVTLSYTSASFPDKNVGTGKTISVSGIALGGTDAGNYSVGTSGTTAANITPFALTVTATGANKVYDGTTADTVTLSDNRISGDVFTDSYTSATFADKNVGNGKTIAVSGISISGGAAGNYTFNTTAATSANITPLALVVTATGNNKGYDATAAATVTLSDNHISGDSITDSFTAASFSDKNVGNGKTINVSGISISGAGIGNYTLSNTTATATASITPRTLHFTATAASKTYDGTTATTAMLSDDHLSGDQVSSSFTAANFADKNAGTAKTVTLSGISVTGTDAGNYTFSNTTTTTANITARTLHVTATGLDKPYDGNIAASVTLTDDQMSGDTLTPTYSSATFSSKTVGSAKPISVTGIGISGPDSIDYTLANTTASTTANITQRMLHVTATGVNKTYDQTTSASVTLSDDQIPGDVLTPGFTSASFASKNAGTGDTINVFGLFVSGSDAGNYILANSTATTTANITPLALTVTPTAQNKVYDGTIGDTATFTDNRLSGDQFTINYTANFADKNVGTGKTVNLTGINLAGTDAGNYSVSPTTTASANITSRTLHVTPVGVNKVYDGTIAATVTLSDDRIAGDSLTTSYSSSTYADKNVGSGKTITVSGILVGGADAGNYTPVITGTTTASITARTLHVSATGTNKPYDGTTAATVTLTDDRVGGDSLTESYTAAAFADKNAGNGKTINVSGISFGGADAGNYTLASTAASATANVTPRTLNVIATGVNKVYDGTTSATVTFGDDRLSGDVLTESDTSATFADKNVGNGKTINVSGISLSGTDSANYTLGVTTATATANITARSLNVGAIGNNKVYDGTPAATVTLSDNRISGDSLTDTYTSATFSDKNVGNGKTITVNGISVAGADAGNYNINISAAATGNITPLALTVTAAGVNRPYDGTTAATVTLSDNRINGDSLTDSYTSATFGDKNVGTGKAVNVSGISINGTDSSNYTLSNTTAATTANITPRTLDVSAAGVNKIYDGTAAATVTLSDDHVGTDQLSETYASATFSDKNVGTSKSITVSGISLSGADAGNYTLGNATASATANITARSLTVTAAGVNKVYDGTTAATVTLSDNRVGGDSLTDTYASAAFVNKNAGNGKTISVGGISLSGTDAANYTLGNTTATASANITPLALNVTATGNNKVYDGTTAATVTLADNRVSGDSLTDSYTSATFSDKNVGNGKTITVNGISVTGTDSGNYSINISAAATANITPLSLTVTAAGVNKVYDGNTAATVTLLDNRISGDSLTDTYTAATFVDKNVANSKTVSVSGISLGGTDAGNYSLGNTTATASANITVRPLTVTATGNNKVYDGTTAATVTVSDNGVSGDNLTDSYTSASFSDKNVGNGKSITVNGIFVGGADASNYSINVSAAATANITPLALNVTATGNNKTYDGTTSAAVTLSDNRISGDSLTDNYTTASFADKNVGSGKSVSVSGISISGTDAGNYSLSNTTANASANITPRTLHVTATGNNKTYDGTTAATVTLSDDHVGTDQVSETYTSASFSSKTVGTAKPISVGGISFGGADAANYTLGNTTANASANITPLALTVAAAGNNKVYDGTTTATVTLNDNHIAGDSVTDSYTTAAFSDKNAGTAKTVSVSGITISGTDAGNYTFNTTATTTANITPLTLTVTAAGVNKTYDGTPAAAVTLTDNRIGGDVFTDSYSTATFSDKNVGTAKTINVSGISIGGTDAANYTFNNTATATANITPLALTLSGTNKVYDGTPSAAVTLANAVGGDNVTLAYTSAGFADKNVGTGKTINVSGITLGGTDAGNYSIGTTGTATANITPLALTVTASGVNKPYDGTTAATVTLFDNRISGDNLTDSYTTATFADKNVANGKTISVSGISLGGTDAANYTLGNTTATTTANITPMALTVTATGTNKVYDGTTAATITLSDNHISGDVVTDNFTSAAFSDKNVANAKTISVTGISLGGADAGNYTFNTTATTTANITPLALTVTAMGTNKVYDGTTAAVVTLSDNVLGSDSVDLNYTSSLFSNRNVGTGKTVTVNGLSISGADAGNYTLGVSSVTTTANITPRTLNVSAVGSNKVYDGTPIATVTLSDDRVAGDVFTVGDSNADFSDKNVGTGKTITVFGLFLSGSTGANYTLSSTTATTSANITPLSLTVTAAGVNKTYDGTPAAAVTLTDNRIGGDVFTDSYSTATFSDKNVGTAKTINVSGISIGGTDAANYTFNNTATATANITPLALTLSGTNKVYDGTPSAAVTLANAVGGDNVTLAYTSAGFADKNVGTGKTINVSGITLGGTDAGNYSIGTTGTATANITPLALTVTASGVNKPYDGTTAATVTLFDNRISGDNLTDSYTTATFADKNVANGKTISVSGISLGGTDAANYTLGNTTATTTANITPELSIPGTAAADSITLALDADGQHIDWFLNGGIVGQLAMNDPAGLTINGNGSNDAITLQPTGSGAPTLPNTLHLNGTFTVNGLSGSNPLANTNMEIGRSTVFLNYTPGNDPLALIQNYLKNGYNNGSWTGSPTASTGVITSTPAAQNAAQTTAIGYADSADRLIAGQPANTIELKYTLYGDTRLAGNVGFNDFTTLTQHYNQTSGGTWDTGDFNYDGSVNFGDFTLMTRTYNTSLGSQASPAASPAAASATAVTSAASASPAAATTATSSTAGAAATTTAAPATTATAASVAAASSASSKPPAVPALAPTKTQAPPVQAKPASKSATLQPDASKHKKRRR